MFWTIIVFLVLGSITAYFSSVPIPLPDTPTYIPVPGQNVFSQVSLLGNAQRPWVVTLPYAVIKNYQLIILFQIALSLASWATLLWASDFLRIRSPLLTWTTRAIIGSIGLSSLVIIWNAYLQSDSLAMTGTVLLIAGFLAAPSRIIIGPVILIAGALIVSQIRIVTALPILLMAALLLITPIRDLVRRRTITPARFMSVGITAACLVLTVLYGTSVNNTIDIYWGNEVIPGSNIHGRTLQQIGVINMPPWGNLAVVDLLANDKLTCLQPYFPPNKPGVYWRPIVVHKCPVEAKLFSDEFPAQYSAWVLHHSRLVATSIIDPFNQSFSVPNATTYLSLSPDPLVMLWSTGSSGANPVMLGLLLLMVADIWMVVRRCPGRYEILQMTLLACGGFVSVFLTVIGSPSDTQRVGSAPAMIARMFVIFGLILFCDRNLTRDRSPSSIPRRSAVNDEGGPQHRQRTAAQV